MKKILLIVLFCLLPVICYANKSLTVIINNNFDETVLVYIDSIDHSLDYPFPIPIFGGEIKAHEFHIMLKREYNQPPYRYILTVQRWNGNNWYIFERKIICIEPAFKIYFVDVG